MIEERPKRSGVFSEMESCAKVKKTFAVVFAAVIFSTVACLYAPNVSSSYFRFWDLSTAERQKRRVSAVILTYKEHENFSKLLDSVFNQKHGYFELIIADTGCIPETKEIIKKTFSKKENKWLHYKYIQLCDNPGYAIANNEAVKLVDPLSEWILLLNDDVIMQGDDFITSMLELGDSKSSVAGAVGCSLRTIDGNNIQESGSIVWNDGSALGYGRGRTDLDSPEFNYPRPVDYISGACLMIRKNIFDNYGGFDNNHFTNYYEDTDLQMHVQHDLKKQVWLQPKAVALHNEHGTFGAEESKKKMETSAISFQHKWKSVLVEHDPTPIHLSTKERNIMLLKASDLRARDPTKANILYIDSDLPNRHNGGGYGRAFDNLSMLAELGHRITVVSYGQSSIDWCNEDCHDEIRQLGVELVLTPWEEFAHDRIGFYEIVIVSRPTTLRLTYLKLRKLFQKSSFAIIYDCEALWYRRDEGLAHLYKNGIEFPSIESDVYSLEEKQLIASGDKEAETKLLAMADVVVPVSKKEEDIISDMIPGVKIQSIGHIMNLEKELEHKKDFNQRNGLLFIASFGGEMYYNGDAIWYFLKNIYPLILKEYPIPLTIAGRKIPKELKTFIRDSHLNKHVILIESPEDLDHLYESHRIFIAPHLYGSGIQYKLSEAFSYGIPCVMSKPSAEAFSFTPKTKVTCIGDSPESFKNCVLTVYESKKKWTEIRDNGISFIRKTHNRLKVMQDWSGAISVAKQSYLGMKAIERTEDEKGVPPSFITHNLFSTDLWTPLEPCVEGEVLYLKLYPDVKDAMNQGAFSSAFAHWRDFGQQEGRKYVCKHDEKEVPKPKPTRRIQKSGPPKKSCPEGEKDYFERFPDVEDAVKLGSFPSGFAHWIKFGKVEGKSYECDEFEEVFQKLVQPNSRSLVSSMNVTVSLTIPGSTTMFDISMEELVAGGIEDFKESLEDTFAETSGADDCNILSLESAEERKVGVDVDYELIKYVETIDGFLSSVGEDAEALAAIMIDQLKESVRDGSFLDVLQQNSDLEVVQDAVFQLSSFEFEDPVVEVEDDDSTSSIDESILGCIVCFIKKLFGMFDFLFQ